MCCVSAFCVADPWRLRARLAGSPLAAHLVVRRWASTHEHAGRAKLGAKLGLGEPDDKTGKLLKCIAGWAAVLTILWAATGMMVLSYSSDVAGLRT